MGKFIITEEEKNRIRGLYEQTISAGDDVTVDKLPKEIQDFVKTYRLTGTFNQTGVDGQLGTSFGYRKGNVSSGISVKEIEEYEKNKGNINKCFERGNKFKEIYNSLSKTVSDPMELKKEAQSELDKLYPNMQYCGVIQKVQNIINMK